MQDAYEIVVGLEVHAQLLTESKLFSGESTRFGDEPNTNISTITLAHPGSLPVMNRKAIECAIKAGLALNCEIEKKNYFVRKNYFYPDLPKGYQVSQHTTPICKGGYVMIKTIEGKKKKIRLNRIHLEEDAGKSLHELDENFSALDFNRAGVPLIEIVSEPDIRSGEEAYEYLNELRRLVRYLGICDGNMEEGSMRCDANISVRKKGDPKLGSRVEVKNLNSMRNVKKAIEYEGARLIGLLENNEKVKQQTRSFDATTGTTFAIREKEEAEDYRYFPEPDLTAFDLGDEFIDNIRRSIPVLREQRIAIYKEKFSLSDYDSATLTDEKEFSDYFEELVKHVSNYKAAANWMLGPVRSWLNEKGITIEGFPLGVRKLATLVNMVEDGRLSFSTASSRLFHSLLQDPAMEPEVIAEKLNLLQVKESDFLEPMVLEVLEQYKEKVKEYKKGKKGLLALFVGEVMKRSKGKADPVRVNEIMIEKLKTF